MIVCVVLQCAVLIGDMQLGFEAPVFPRCNLSLHYKCQLTKRPIAHAAARMCCRTQGNSLDGSANPELVQREGGSRLTQCSGPPRYGAPTSRRTCIQGFEAHARASNSPLFRSRCTHAHAFYLVSAQLIAAFLPLLSQ